MLPEKMHTVVTLPIDFHMSRTSSQASLTLSQQPLMQQTRKEVPHVLTVNPYFCDLSIYSITENRTDVTWLPGFTLKISPIPTISVGTSVQLCRLTLAKVKEEEKKAYKLTLEKINLSTILSRSLNDNLNFNYLLDINNIYIYMSHLY